MNTSIITNYLIEQGEFIDESIDNELKLILNLDTTFEIKRGLRIFFKSKFPNLNSDELLQKLFPTSIEDAPEPGRISIINSYEKTPNKRSVQDFVRHFNVRFKKIENMLKNRAELSGLTGIGKLKGKNDKDKISIIGMVLEKNETKNGHIILKLEDLSGITAVLVHKDNKELLDIAKDLTLDEIIGVVGQSGGDIIFSSAIIHPDIPLSKELKKSPLDNYAVFLGDMHFGSKEFLKKEFTKFLLWINGKLGTLDQRKMAKKVKYVFIVGDLIEGAGIYPGQENDLEIQSVRGQYEKMSYYLSKIPKHMKIIICPGNHDVGRIAEPQLPLDKEYSKSVWDLPNVILVSNPATVSIDVTENFSGIDVLMYHGYSMIYYSDAIESIRAAGGQKVSDDIMIYLLKRRHLAPTHGSTLYIPDIHEDAAVIDPIPDIFATGHIHRAQSKKYRNVTCISSSCWTQITEDQEKRGLEPQPARAIIVSLKTREVKIMNFNSGKDATTVSQLKQNQQEEKDKADKKKEETTK